ncbi:histidine kinase dimerization/phospho-acceptor domain-containing protein [Pseudacidovorax intermedius]|uniref:histidine kinase n=1 Tax=Pseudacidovorax intermedius TaxID=433924 RepID=A0A147HCN8_9BURK|nr:histidine kinase dimerization/phospho-acceptor domain-containing protein [Pseudacidovorax intermedius]KTT27891.1 hypothetical protein NS331_00580 [Pseudacidovorax intermedius]
MTSSLSGAEGHSPAALVEAVRAFDHDARSPLSALAAAAELLDASDDPGLQAEAREVIVRQVKRLSALFAGFRERMAMAGVEKDGG